MGQEINATQFTERDFTRFRKSLSAETRVLRDWFAHDRLSHRAAMAGVELEAWLVNNQGYPVARNAEFLATVNSPLVVAELAKFNIELNVAPSPLVAHGLSELHQNLADVWELCARTARNMDLNIAMIGILPTVTDNDLTLSNMSDLKRYRALNDQVLRTRAGQPLVLNIVGHDHLQSSHHDVMLESATTSFQVHIQAPMHQAHHYLNAAIMASGPMVALAANSPFLFGKQLWEESRIPLFEQAVDIGGYGGASHGPVKRVTFGSGYANRSVVEFFQENAEHYPVLLPMMLDADPAKMAHIRLHNGTIWRWNRPLIGFDDDGTPHFRIEHRVMAAGPTISDQIANAAVFYGIAAWLVDAFNNGEHPLPFSTAKSNFYECARLGLDAHISWLKDRRATTKHIVLDDIIPNARAGLKLLALAPEDIDRYLAIVEARVDNGQTGANWQRRFAAKRQGNMAELTLAYLERQEEGLPVHRWPL